MKKAILFFLSLLYGAWSYGQSLVPEVIATAGDYFSSSTAQLSWTLAKTPRAEAAKSKALGVCRREAR